MKAVVIRTFGDPDGLEVVDVPVSEEQVDVRRVAINRPVDQALPVRQEGDVTIVPVFEEVLVKRILLREEIRISRKQHVAEVEDVVRLRTQDVVVDRASRGRNSTNSGRKKS